LIIVGTPNWSQYVDQAAANQIQGEKNIAYTLHYYAGSHKQDLRDKATEAINSNLPIFVTEYGLVNADGNGEVNDEESNKWWEFLDANKISHVNWALGDKDEGSAALRPGTQAGEIGDYSKLTASGALVRSKLESY
jgi:endoglucanase